MKKLLLGCLLLLTLVQACRKYNDTTQNGPIPTENIKSSLTGQVIDENGNPVAGALVLLENGNSQITDTKGMFFYHDQLLNKNGAYIKVEKAGYFTSARFSFQHLNSASLMQVQLIPKKLAGTFDAASGGQFSFDNGAEVTIPARGLVTASGAAYSGTVKAYAVWLDPSQQRTFDQMPGDLRAIDANGNGKILTTYGMIGVELEGGAGEKLQIAPNQKAKITLTVPSSMQNKAPATIPLWHFDESNGYWKEEGNATLNNGRYEGEVSHFSFWNCDVPFNYILINGSVYDNLGNPLSNIRVKITGNYGVTSSTITDANGTFIGLAIDNLSFTVDVLDQCGQVAYTEDIPPFTADATLPDIVITTPKLVTVTGTLTDCNNVPLAYSAVTLESGSGLRIGVTDYSGVFSFSFLNCTNIASFLVTGYSGVLINQSVPQTFPVVNNMVNTGAIEVCSGLDEYIQLNIDGHEQVYSVGLQCNILPEEEGGGDVVGGGGSGTPNFILMFGTIINGQASIQGLFGEYRDASLAQQVSFGCEYIPGGNCPSMSSQSVIFSNLPSAPGEYAIGSATGNVMVNGVLKPYTLSFRIKQ